MHSVGRAGAWTLVELVVVVAILAVLAAIVAPILTSVRLETRRTPLLSALRQIGAASQMYLGDTGGFDGHATSLVQSGVLDPALMASPFDPIPIGLANIHRRVSPELGLPDTVYKDSVLVLAECVGSTLRPSVETSRGAGWAVIFVDRLGESFRGDWRLLATFIEATQGRYFRLSVDSAVLKRRTFRKQKADALGVVEYSSMTWLFTDETDRFQ